MYTQFRTYCESCRIICSVFTSITFGMASSSFSLPIFALKYAAREVRCMDQIFPTAMCRVHAENLRG